MFVNRMLEPDEERREFIATDNPDVFIKNVEYLNWGDFVMKTVSSDLRILILIVSSNESAYCIPFVPIDPVMKKPLYVAFTSNILYFG